MTFNKSKILTSSARDYADSVGKNLRDYALIGFSYCVEEADMPFDQIFSGVGRYIPAETEVITDIQFACVPWRNKPCLAAIVSGTALVPKAQTSERK